tara:strand:- start:144700 stop:145722 length:1023 start_codon:yes stop_codon:yes gene_type:complete
VSLHIQLEKFEGPMGLLLYLIRKEEMNIFDINIHQITQQYLEYIRAMRKLDLEVAGDFVAMAATLLQIKSKMLLPQYDENGEEIEETEDPRKELVQKLIEYQMYKEASHKLYERPLVGRDVYLRGRREEVVLEDDDEVEVEDNPLFALIRSYRSAIKNMKRAVHKVGMELQSIAERVQELRYILKLGETTVFKKLITAKSSVENQVLITFLSFLELGKLGYVSLYQSAPLSDIYVKSLRPIDDQLIDSGAYSYVTEENIMQNEGANLTLDLDQESEEPHVEEVTEEEAEALVAGEEVKDILQTPVAAKDEPIEVEAATDDEIELELKRLNINDSDDEVLG